jgi:K+-dependent Na+/Ca+ exchanger-like protein
MGKFTAMAGAIQPRFQRPIAKLVLGLALCVSICFVVVPINRNVASLSAPARNLDAVIGKQDEPKCVGTLCETKVKLEKPTVWWFLLNLCGLFYMFVALYIVCDEFFVPCLDKISNKLNLSPDVAGATFMAAGGSAPEFFTSAIGSLSPEPSDVGIAAIVGSAVFNVLFVIGACGLCSPGELTLTWYPLARDCTFYFVALVGLLLAFLDTQVAWWEALLLFLLYVVYCVFMSFSSTVQKKCTHGGDSSDEDEELQRFKELDSNKDGFLSAEEVSEYEDLRERFNIMDVNRDNLVTYNEYRVYLRARRNQSRDGDSSGSDDDPNPPMGLGPPEHGSIGEIIWYIFTFPLVLMLVLTVPDVRRTGCWENCYVIGFVMSIVWVAIFSLFMVKCSEVVGMFTGIDPNILALTLLAWGTSVPDLLTSVLVTVQGHGDMAVSSSIGSNLFDVTVGLPVPWLLFSIIHGAAVPVGNDGLITSVGMLVAMVVATILGIMLNGWLLDLKLGIFMLVAWLIFQVYSIWSFVTSK